MLLGSLSYIRLANGEPALIKVQEPEPGKFHVLCRLDAWPESRWDQVAPAGPEGLFSTMYEGLAEAENALNLLTENEDFQNV